MMTRYLDGELDSHRGELADVADRNLERSLRLDELSLGEERSFG